MQQDQFPSLTSGIAGLPVDVVCFCDACLDSGPVEKTEAVTRHDEAVLPTHSAPACNGSASA